MEINLLPASSFTIRWAYCGCVPLISLMKDQVDAANQLGIPATFINSSLDGYETARRFQEIDRQQYRLLYIAPERFIMPDFIQAMKRWNVRMIAIDEAHCISQWGMISAKLFTDGEPARSTAKSSCNCCFDSYSDCASSC